MKQAAFVVGNDHQVHGIFPSRRGHYEKGLQDLYESRVFLKYFTSLNPIFACNGATVYLKLSNVAGLSFSKLNANEATDLVLQNAKP